MAQGGQEDLGAIAENVALHRGLNELRHDLLEERAEFIDRWLAVIALVLTFFGIVIAIAGLWAYRSFRDIEAEAKRSSAAAREHEHRARLLVDEITKHRVESEKRLGEIRDMTAEAAGEEPQQASMAAAAVREDPDASPVDRAIGHAVSLQGKGHTHEAIDLWRLIAKIGEAGNDDALQAKARYSIAYLQGMDDPEESIANFRRVIELDPKNLNAYGNRGFINARLGRHEEAIADFDRVIELDPSEAKGYLSRGDARGQLGRHEEAIADYDRAIELDPGNAAAYRSRGIAKGKLGRHEEANADYGRAGELDPDRESK